MRNSFFINYEQKLRSFERELRKLILDFLNKKREVTTFEINNYLRSHSAEFNSLYRKHRTKAWYRARKILEGLEKEGIIKKKLSTDIKDKFRFLAYKWFFIKSAKKQRNY